MAYMQAEVEKLNAQQLALATERLRALKAMEAAGEIPFVDALGAYTDCLAEYYDNQGIPQLTELAQSLDNETGLWDKTKGWVSFGVDVLPFVGNAKSFVELVSGIDPVTKAPVSRYVAAACLVVGVIPGAKGALKAGSKGAKVAAEKAAKNAVVKKIPQNGTMVVERSCKAWSKRKVSLEGV